MKKKLSLLMVALVAVAAFAGLRRATESEVVWNFANGEWVVSDLGIAMPKANSATYIEEPITNQGITMTTYKSTTFPGFFLNQAGTETSLRVYKIKDESKGAIEFSVAEGTKLTKIVMNGDSKLAQLKADKGSIELSNSNKTLTWTSEEGVQSVKFENDNSSNTVRINDITFTKVTGGDEPAEIASMAIVGDFLGLEVTDPENNPNWNPANGWEMTQSTEDPAIWTLTKEVTVEGKKYEYKATANDNWDDCVCPAGDNADFIFGTNDYPAGTYTLTFTANTTEKSVSLTAVKKEEPQGIVPNGTYYVMNADAGKVVNAESALDAKGAPISFTYNGETYTIAGADFFAEKQWTIENAIEGMSGYYTISTGTGEDKKFLAAAANGSSLEMITDGTADAAVWILLGKSYWEDIVNSTYTVAGTKDLTGTENDWDIVEANNMKYNDETALYEITYKKIAVNNEAQPKFKVVQTNMEGQQTWYPENDWVITPTVAGGEGIYDITITFDPSDYKEVGVSFLKYEDIEISPAEGDIAEALAKASAGKKVRNITINLTTGVTYTLSSSIEAKASLTINGNDAIIDASNLKAPFVNYASIEGEFAMKDETTPSAYVIVDKVRIAGVTVKGLAKSIINNASGTKTLFKDVLFDWVNIELIGSNNAFALGTAYANNFTIQNSTIWSKEGHTGLFFKADGKPADVSATETTTWTVDKSTLVNIAVGKKANNSNGGIKGKSTTTMVLTNSLLYNFASNVGNEVNGWLWGQNGGANATYANNAYLNADGVVSGWTAADKGGSDQTGTSIAGTIAFADAANGDFNGTFQLAEGAVVPEALGAPAWKIDFKLPTYTATFKTDAAWEKFYAYTWSGEGESKVEELGAWPGTEMTPLDGIDNGYGITIEASIAPKNIIFNNGVGGYGYQTGDEEFVDKKEYTYTSPFPANAIWAGTLNWEEKGFDVSADKFKELQAGDELDITFLSITGDKTDDWNAQIHITSAGYDVFKEGVGKKEASAEAPYVAESTISGVMKNQIIKSGLNIAGGNCIAYITITKAETPAAENSLCLDVKETVGSWGGVQMPSAPYAAGDVVTIKATEPLVSARANRALPEENQVVIKRAADGWPDFEPQAVVATRNAAGDAYEFTVTDAIVADINANGFIIVSEKPIVITEVDLIKAPEDIEISPAEGDIAAALAAASAGKNVRNITINLTTGVTYTMSSSIEAKASLTINGNDAIIDASALNAPFVNYASIVGEFAMKDETTPSAYVIVDKVRIAGVTVKGLAKSIINNASGTKTLFKDVLFDWVNIELIGSNNAFALGTAYANNFTIQNSTIWSKEGHTGLFFKADGKPADVSATETTTWTVDKSTLVNIAVGKKANNSNGGIKGKSTTTMVLTNSLLYNFASNVGNEVNGWLWGQNGGANATYANNAYLNADGVVSGWTAADKGGSDQTGTSIAGTIAFADAANGDFNGEFQLAEGAEAPAALGAPMWIITFVKPDVYIVAGNNAEIFGTSWDATNEANKMTKGADGKYSKTYTASDATADVQLKVVENGTTWHGDASGNNVTFDLTAAGDFTVAIDPSTKEITVTGDNVKFPTDFDYTDVYAVGNGSEGWLNNKSWEPGAEENKMTKVSDGIFEITFNEVPAGTGRQVKFAIDGTWARNFGGSFAAFGEETAAVYDGGNIAFDTTADLPKITIRLDLTGFVFATKTGAKFTISAASATGINAVKNADALKDAQIYNLNGQRVDKAQKGLYIVNGKKVVLK